MSIYSLLFLLSSIGMLFIARRNRKLFYKTSFAQFMGVLGEETANLWHNHLRERSFLFLEKTIRTIRLLFVKMEMNMLRMLNLVRGIKEKNSSDEKSDS